MVDGGDDHLYANLNAAWEAILGALIEHSGPLEAAQGFVSSFD